MSEKRGIIGAGNWLVDNIKTIDRWPGEGNLCNISGQQQASGGGAANILFDLAAMTGDIPLYAAGKVGRDSQGEWLLKEIKRRNIDASCIGFSDSPTSYTDVFSGNGKRTFFHCRGANRDFMPNDLDHIQIPAKIFYLGYLLLLDGLDAEDSEFGTGGARLLKKMQEKGYYTVVDFVSEAPEKFRKAAMAAIPYIDAIILNEIEAGNAFGLKIRRDDDTLDTDAMKQAAHLFLENGVKHLAAIHFPEGSFAVTATGEEVYVPSCKVDSIVGSNGAGDAFCAGMLYSIHQGLPLKESLQLSCVNAAFNLKSLSATDGAVSVEKLRERIAAEYGD